MAPGHDALAILTNQVLRLELGHVGVVNSSPTCIEQKSKDGQSAKPKTTSTSAIIAARAFEREFFIKHPAYFKIAEKCGSLFLQKTLAWRLQEHIHKDMPRLREELVMKLADLEPEVSS